MHNNVKASQSPMYAWTEGSRAPTTAQLTTEELTLLDNYAWQWLQLKLAFATRNYHAVSSVILFPGHHTWGLARNEILNSSYFVCQTRF